ncbi:uncharacterized protein LOC110875851 [Helianthus annuus]|uniref:uncharacterized protein LOC110875851 n=1 Tax=Helianthus annuus TaxID=4232 RepID=UPI000B8F1A1C|nr:uncharacterized protein LOC110875851 [Helianthus annuus]
MANATTWDDFKELIREEYYPRDEIQKLENEYYNLKMLGSEIEAYTKWSHELANMCPNLSRPPHRKIELYIKGLAPQVKGLVTAANLDNLPQIIRLAHKITDQEVECGSLPPRTTATTTTTTPTPDNKHKCNDADKAANSNQSQKKPDNNNSHSFSQSSSVNQNQSNSQTSGSYAGKQPKCNKCGFHHYASCNRACQRYDKNANNNNGGNNNRHNNNNAGNNNNGNNGGNGARGRVFTIGAGDVRNDGSVVTGTFSVNGCFASVLFDSGADWSYVSLGFSRQLGLTLTPLEVKHVVELADGKSIEASHVLLGCKLDLLGQVFNMDLLPVTLGSFDIVIGMDWLSKHRAEILCKEKSVCIPLPSGESLSVLGHRSGAIVSIISSMKTQKCMRKGYPAILALITDTQPKEKRIEDLPVVREFPDVFPEELLGVPPHRQVKFQIDLTPGAAPIAHAPYRLASGELQELANQLQELPLGTLSWDLLSGKFEWSWVVANGTLLDIALPLNILFKLIE